ncbi:MAG: four helix bundle protein [Bacteroidales bacterium]|nr:four helix bundle protein [Bacteroidales bacterium]MCF8386734.1 four helix bundle protein [Bacteroidales bacterium]MCF8397256.1 four helix bundle protein [Bacteroidales bacterium]
MLSEKSFDNFSVWTDSIAFVKEMYVLTNIFPEEEKQGLVPKLRNAAIEIATKISKSLSNLKAKKEDDYLLQAIDLINEIETLLTIAKELSYISSDDLERYKTKTEDLGMQLFNLSRKLNRDREIKEAQNKF